MGLRPPLWACYGAPWPQRAASTQVLSASRRPTMPRKWSDTALGLDVGRCHIASRHGSSGVCPCSLQERRGAFETACEAVGRSMTELEDDSFTVSSLGRQADSKKVGTAVANTEAKSYKV